MIKTILKNKEWFFDLNTGNNYVRGYAFDENNLLRDQQLIDGILEACSKNQLSIFLKKLNGQFGAVIQYGNVTYVIADKLRSFPLFYFRNKDNGWVVTSSMDSVISESPNQRIDKVKEAEYIALGYLQTGTTLLEGCSIVGAGFYVELTSFSEDPRIIEYYSYPLYPIEYSDIKSQAKLKLRSAFERLIISIGNRPIAIPLSGGYDSRLIACLCKEYGLSNVLCFTYGRRDSPEVNMSERVAKMLGFPWYYVEYSSEDYNSFIFSKKYLDFALTSMNLNALPHVQDFIAIEQLFNTGILNENYVLIPGHSGDLLGGSHLTLSKFKGYAYLSDLIFKQYYIEAELEEKYKESILDTFPKKYKFICGGDVDKVSCFHQDWNAKTRQANYIINSVRVYEYFGMDWRVPLWDSDYAEFWLSISSSLKVSSHMYDEFMFDCYFNLYGVNFPKFKRPPIPFLPVPLKRILKKLVLHIPYFKKYLDVNASNINDNNHINRIIFPEFIKSSNISDRAFQSIWLLIWLKKNINSQ